MTPNVARRKQSLDQRLLGEARRAPAAFGLSLTSNALSGILIIAQALFLSRIIAGVFRKGEHLPQVVPFLAVLSAVIVLRALFSYVSAIASARLAIDVKNALRQRLITRLYELGPVHGRDERSGELTVLATDGIEKLDGYYRDYLPGLFAALFLPLAILLLVLPLDLLTFVVLLVTAPLIPLFIALIGMAAGALAKRQFFEMRHLGAHFLDVMQGLTTLKLFNRSQHQIETICRITGQFRLATMDVLRVAFLSALTLEMLSTLSVAIVAVEIGIRLLRGGIGFEPALFLLVIAPEFYLPLRALGAKFHNATEGKAAAERLFEVLDTTIDAQMNSAALPVPSTLEIRFEGVSLAFEKGTRPALNDISFDLKPGQWLALVGASGSGKTTIANLLLRFIQPDAGQITVDGRELGSISIEQWREQIAWVSQSPYLFNSTIAENIRFSRPEADDTQVMEAARAAGAHAFITRLADGYQTPCGERGLRLSGGQVQRIALARALLRAAPLLILDEPTSQLDPGSETAVMQTLRTLTRQRTILLITHRLSTATLADRILVLEKGVVVAQGTHAELVSSGGLYARLTGSDGVAR